jgi:hypothetical protein
MQSTCEDTSHDGDNNKYTLKEIHGRLQKAKEAASKREISLAHAFSQQVLISLICSSTSPTVLAVSSKISIPIPKN